MKSSIQRFPTDLPLPFSKAVKVGGFLFLSGQIPLDENGKPLRADVAAQTKAVMDQIAAILSENGASFDNAVRTTVWLSDLAHFAAFNEVYSGYFPNGFPARSLVAAKLAFDVDVEVELHAWLG